MDRTPRTVRIGLFSDPGLPTELARRLVEELPDALTNQVSDQIIWQVQSRCEPIMLDEHGLIPLLELARQHKPVNGWDVMLLLTDLPRRSGTRPIASQVNISGSVGVMSVPALGAVRLRHRARSLVVQIIRLLVEAELDERPEPPRRGQELAHRISARLAPTRDLRSEDAAIDTQMALIGLRGRLRLLAGMVRDNHPWRLVPQLSSATAAAAATTAYTVFTTDFWKMADALTTIRLVVINLFAMIAMATWLIVYNHLWDRPSCLGGRAKAVLYNVATVLTVLIGVACMYALLYLAALLAAFALIDPGYFQSTLQHPVGPGHYAKLVWLSSSVGIVAGALGSSLESEDAVRGATYGNRERRRKRDTTDPDSYFDEERDEPLSAR